jgi:hypothetical protein
MVSELWNKPGRAERIAVVTAVGPMREFVRPRDDDEDQRWCRAAGTQVWRESHDRIGSADLVEALRESIGTDDAFAAS